MAATEDFAQYIKKNQCKTDFYFFFIFKTIVLLLIGNESENVKLFCSIEHIRIVLPY